MATRSFYLLFLQIPFFLKKFVSATKKNFKSIWNFLLLLKQIFWEKILHNKRKIPGDTQNVFMKLQQFEKFVAISWKSRSCPQSLRFLKSVQSYYFFKVLLLLIHQTCWTFNWKGFSNARDVLMKFYITYINTSIVFKPIRIFAVDINCYLDLISANYMC